MSPNLGFQETVDLVTFTKEILSGKVHFLCSIGFQYAFTPYFLLVSALFGLTPCMESLI